MKLQQVSAFMVFLCFACFLPSSLTLAGDSAVNGNKSVDPIRSPQLTNAVKRGLDSIEKSRLLQSCMAEMLNQGPNLCADIKLRPALRAVRAQLNASGNQIFGLVPTNAIDPAPWATLGAIEAEEDKIDDLAGIVDVGLEGIERCSGGPASPACSVLRSNCFGDWKCYGDNTCACYTCTKGGIPGSCGID